MNNTSIIQGEPATGCRYCKEGSKAVLFLTGKCNKKCYYCPISKKRKDKDKTWINEKQARDINDVYIEIENMDAKGTGITGGEPLKKPDKLNRYIRKLKDRYGEQHHIHLYTSEPIKNTEITELKKSGLDEIRFHPTNLNIDPYHKTTEKASENLETGIEIPAIPDKTNRIQEIIDKTKNHIDFLNLNEFEYSETNIHQLKQKGYKPIGGNNHAIQQSRETAQKIMEQNPDIPIHFCTSNYKDSVQLRKRLQRTSRKTAEPYDEITEDGTIIRAEIYGKKPRKTREILIKQYNVPRDKIGRHKQKTETAWWIADEIYSELEKQGLKTDIIEIYPTSNRFEVQRIPLNQKNSEKTTKK
ncbi:radical SAM protein [Methanonatronarchaeum sp. AMET6-2]|uniref:radical SAM protein n=1 Tax=Methanonatronarchaeum sp. AMET6-2 TaxID=2933293 RepID=UPI001FF25718|nr:radical SAM protein [Methanonatronarchaeum sp. AMET6-2]UOY10362.1 radical SAM protein [Methanonatronarchaeum sp. AMET6-2]